MTRGVSIAVMLLLAFSGAVLGDVVVLTSGQKYVGTIANPEGIRPDIAKSARIAILQEGTEELRRFLVADVDYIILGDNSQRRVITFDPPDSSKSALPWVSTKPLHEVSGTTAPTRGASLQLLPRVGLPIFDFGDKNKGQATIGYGGELRLLGDALGGDNLSIGIFGAYERFGVDTSDLRTISGANVTAYYSAWTFGALFSIHATPAPGEDQAYLNVGLGAGLTAMRVGLKSGGGSVSIDGTIPAVFYASVALGGQTHVTPFLSMIGEVAIDCLALKDKEITIDSSTGPKVPFNAQTIGIRAGLAVSL